MTKLAVLGMALVALAFAPMLHRLFGQRASAKSGIDGFVLGAVGGTVALHVLPRVLVGAGSPALVAFVVGLAVSLALHRLEAPKAGGWLTGLGLLGICTHAAVDGAGLAQGEHALSVAIVLHRLPAGVFVWGLLHPVYGSAHAAAGLGAIALSTVGGFVFMTGVGDEFLLFEAFVAGALTHVVIGHSSRSGCSHARTAVWEFAGALMGFALAGSFVHSHESGPLAAYGTRLLHLALETAPALLLGFTFAGLFVGFLPRRPLRWIAGGGYFQQAARGVLFGAPIPICSCGVLPAYEGLVRRGAPAVAAMAFLVATPELGVEAILLSFPLLGWELTSARIVAAVAIALLVGLVVGSHVTLRDSAEEATAGDTPSLAERLWVMVRFGYGEVVDHTMPWIAVGLAVAALLVPGQLAPQLAAAPREAQVVLFALISVPVYVCASGATPLAAALILAGASSGSAVAFLLAGPATNVTTFGVLSRLHGRGVALFFGAMILGLATLSGLLVDGLLSSNVKVPSHEAGHVAFGWASWLSGLGVAGLLLSSLVRRGPRHFFVTLLQPRHHHHADH